jgi:peptidoglycan-associated lipoprotein
MSMLVAELAVRNLEGIRTMNRQLPTLLPMIVLAAAVAACAPKPPPQLETPPTTAAPVQPAAPAPERAGQVQSGVPSIVPGSQADLKDKAGTDTVLFAYDSYELDAEARGVLARHAEWLKANPGVRITLEGHCDERGTREYNLALGDRRANSAKNFLAGQGIDVGRITTVSYGKERPAVAGSDDAAHAQNRRAVTMVMGG